MAGTGNSGRRRLAPQTHLLRGTFQRSRHGGHEVPEPPRGTPEPPGPLTPVAQAEWQRMITRLEQSGTLSVVDDAALYQYAKLYAETEQIEADQAEVRRLALTLAKPIKKLQGATLVDALQTITALRGLIAKATRDLRQGHMAIRQYLVEFGMTPSARTRVKLPPRQPTVDPNKARYFGSGA
jgi:phage terminase small subunit